MNNKLQSQTPRDAGAVYEFYGWQINPTIDNETGDLMLFAKRMDGCEVEVDPGRELSTDSEFGVCLTAVPADLPCPACGVTDNHAVGCMVFADEYQRKGYSSSRPPMLSKDELDCLSEFDQVVIRLLRSSGSFRSYVDEYNVRSGREISTVVDTVEELVVDDANSVNDIIDRIDVLKDLISDIVNAQTDHRKASVISHAIGRLEGAKEYLSPSFSADNIKPLEVLIEIDGGVIQDATVPKGVIVRVRDFDTDGCDPDNDDIETDDNGEDYISSFYEYVQPDDVKLAKQQSERGKEAE